VFIPFFEKDVGGLPVTQIISLPWEDGELFSSKKKEVKEL
jgi:hypothetical protein